MKRLIKDTLIISIFSALYLCAMAGHSFAMGLKENAVIRDNVITLGDIFYGLPGNESKVLGPAPRPGSDMVLNANTLMRIAIALDLPWRPTDSAERVILRRAATIITPKDIYEKLKNDIAAKGYGQSIEIDFPADTSEIILPEDQPAVFDVSDLDIDQSRGWFEATLSAPSKESPIYTGKISGKIHRMIDVPVLRDTLRNGSIITRNDIDIVQMREAELTPKMLISTDAVLGMTPRRISFAGRPLSEDELQAPQIITRGDDVTIVLKSGSMTLTASGKSLESGAKGDFVRAINANSNRTIQGLITGEKEITVSN